MHFFRDCERSGAIQLRLRYLDCFAASLLAMTALATCTASARDLEMGGDNQYPYSIMKPEPGTTPRHRSTTATQTAPVHQPRHASLLGREKFVGKLHRRPGVFTARGTSGSVLPTPLPRTTLIPPEGRSAPIVRIAPQEQGPSIVPGVAQPVPNLPHGPETFQDRASRCATQSSLFNVPGAARSQYIGGCVN